MQHRIISLALLALFACKKDQPANTPPTATTRYTLHHFIQDDTPPTRVGLMVNEQVRFCCMGYGNSKATVFNYPLGVVLEHRVAAIDSNNTQLALDTVPAGEPAYVAVAYGLVDGGTPIAPKLWIFPPDAPQATGMPVARFGHAAWNHPPVTLYANGNLVASNTSFGTLTDALMLPAPQSVEVVVTDGMGDTLYANPSLAVPAVPSLLLWTYPAQGSAQNPEIRVVEQQL